MKVKIIVAVWMFLFFVPTILTIYLINIVEWYILVPFQFSSTVLLILLFFKFVDWRNKKIHRIKSSMETLG